MQDKENQKNNNKEEEENVQNDTDIKAGNEQNTDEKSGSEKGTDFEAKASELNDKYLRLYSDFDNYRKRTLKERSELIKTAAEDVFKNLLPVIDDFERALRANDNVDDVKALKDGFRLIYNKLKNNVQQKGLMTFDSLGQPFDPDMMEAVTHVPAEDPEKKGKVIDEIEKGYKLGDKVIRFAKVVVAQ
jgi:molecular chaperone GrpE